VLGIIKRNFRHLTCPIFTWLDPSRFLLFHLGTLREVQKRAIKLLPALGHLSYPDRLKACKIMLLHHRRTSYDRDIGLKDSIRKLIIEAMICDFKSLVLNLV